MHFLPIIWLGASAACLLRRPGLLIGTAFASYQFSTFYGLPSLGAAFLFMMLGITIWFVLLEKRIPFTSLDALVAVFFLAYLASAFYSGRSTVGMETAGRFFLLCGGYYLVGRFFSAHPVYRNHSVFDIGISTTVLSILFGFLALNRITTHTNRLSFEDASAVGFSQLLDVAAGFCAIYFLAAFHQLSWLKRSTFLGFFFVVFFILLLNGTRGSVLSIVLAVLSYLSIRFVAHQSAESRFKKILYVGVLASALTLFSAYFFAVSFDDQFALIMDRFSILLGQSSIHQDPSSLGRILRYTRAWEMFTQEPFFGHGIGSHHQVTGLGYPHNLFLELLAECGLLVTSLLVIIIAITLIKALGYLLRKDVSIEFSVAFGIFVVALAHQQISFALWLAKPMFFFMGALIGLSYEEGNLRHKIPKRTYDKPNSED